MHTNVRGCTNKRFRNIARHSSSMPDFVDAIEHLAFLLEKLNRDHEASPLWERILSLKKHA